LCFTKSESLSWPFNAGEVWNRVLVPGYWQPRGLGDGATRRDGTGNFTKFAVCAACYALINVTVDSLSMRRQWSTEVRSGGSFYSHNDLRIHFGIAKANRIDLLEVRCPSGRRAQFTDVPVNQFFKIVEGENELFWRIAYAH
jgi:ASPIC and UnbV